MKICHLSVLLALILPVAALAQDAAIATAIDYVTTNHDSFGATVADVSDIAVTDAYTSQRSRTTHVYLRQRYEGIEVIDANIDIHVDGDGFVATTGGLFEHSLADRIPSTAPAISAIDAAYALADDVGLSPSEGFIIVESEGGPSQAVVLSDGGISLEPIPARLIYHEIEEAAQINLAWEVVIYEMTAQHWWVGRVDAMTGNVLARYDRVVNDVWVPEHLIIGKVSPSLRPSASEATVAPMMPTVGGTDYRAYPIPVEAPHNSPVPPPADGRILDNNPADATASPFGWHDTNGVPGNEFTTLRGNNTHTYLDTNNDNNPDAGGADCGPSIICDFDNPINFNVDAPSTYKMASEAELFYWTNLIHDVTHRHGFDEPSGNFQVNNYGNGGLGNDDVRAEGQDGGGDCNANFGTPADGSRPRMQMYLCSSPNPDRDGDFDHGVIAHEYGHGISNRLVGGPNNVSCLQNTEQMGEGWSDYLALLMTIEPGDAGADGRGIGTWLFGQGPTGGGIRPTRYSTNFAINPRVHADICSQVVPHGVGYVWATIMWEVTWEMIDAYGFNPDIYDPSGTAGNQIMFQLLIEGMKQTSCSPGFVDARDGIIAADQSLYGGAHLFELWEAFARRGLGFSATQGSSGNKCDNTNAFDNPIPVELLGFSATVDGDDIVLNWNTASETNNAGFEVQRLTDESNNDVLGFVEGHGTTTEAQAYSFRASGLDVGVHTFRLKQIDFDGAFEFGPEVEVALGVVGNYVLSDVYPNPFNPQTQFTLAVATAQNVNIAVYDVMGRRVAMLHEGHLAANETYNFTVDGSNLASGAYFVRIAGETFADARRITLLK